MILEELTFDCLRSLLDYDPETGIFRWRVSRGRASSGSIAGARAHHGYISIGIFGRIYYAHRLAWFWMTGSWPSEEVDHEDTDTSNNSWLNLRKAAHHQNMRNRGMQKNNTSGFKGVVKIGSNFRAQIQSGENHHNLGTFKTPQEAHAAYLTAAKLLHGEFARAA